MDIELKNKLDITSIRIRKVITTMCNNTHYMITHDEISNLKDMIYIYEDITSILGDLDADTDGEH